MPVILLRPRKTHPHPSGRPTHCPYCGSSIFHRWGQTVKTVKDRLDLNAIAYRYRCEECERTFRDYPEGIDRSDFTRGTRQLAALIWAFGLSYRDIIGIFKNYGISLSRSTVWREGKKLASQLGDNKLKIHDKRFTIDKNYIHKVSSTFGIVVAIDVGSGHYTILGTLNEHNPYVVQSWLGPLVKDADIDIIQLGTSKLDLLHDSETIDTSELYT
jgi:transposase-like protein